MKSYFIDMFVLYVDGIDTFFYKKTQAWGPITALEKDLVPGSRSRDRKFICDILQRDKAKGTRLHMPGLI